MIVIALAVARVTRMLLYENGPGGVIWQLRNRLGAHEEVVPMGSLQELFNCRWCLSLWVSMLAVLCTFIWKEAALSVCSLLAIAMLAGLAVRYSEDAL